MFRCGRLYSGELGRKIVNYLRQLGGTLTMADLADVKPRWGQTDFGES
ncbi:MAG: hypothetical protein EOR92_33495 [Mesorhizobium sp.]|nr:MAG: hypothetical protein EOR92_33495 [Mesorhizobium sp.]